jgi:hypothetical protein
MPAVPPQDLVWVNLCRMSLADGSRRSLIDLSADRRRNDATERRWDRIPDLNLDASPGAADLEVVREALEPRQLGDPEPPVLPVERSNVGSRLSLDGWSRSPWVELEQEGPVTRAVEAELDSRSWLVQAYVGQFLARSTRSVRRRPASTWMKFFRS